MDKRPLRILAIVNLPWDARLGASRVWMELADQWRASGHTVEKFALTDAFPGVRATRITFALRQLIFMRKAAAFIRKHGHRFDVIDALVGTVPATREDLSFRGLLVARSVGLFRRYERLEQSAPQPERGKLIGRVLYRFTHRRLRRASIASLRHADVVNVPNDEEAQSLRDDLHIHKPVLVEPYGLTDERRAAFSDAAQLAATRFAQQRVCFVGMWSPRKGALDWPQIITRVRADLPHARFRFLGTMVDEAVIRRDLATIDTAGIEFISSYEPDDLPRWLAECAVGAFPSYVEGFGLAVLEQLAAGIPTVAYDTAGPRDILSRGLPECLVQSGDVLTFGARIVELLRASPDEQRERARRSMQIAATFSWREIAERTIAAYRRQLKESAHPIAFVQPFSLGSAGGGARILRALLADAPFAWRSISSAPVRPKPWRNELHLPSRPSWGPLDHSRLAALPQATTGFFARRFRRRLKSRVIELGASAIHAVAHGGLDFAAAHSVARELSLPFFLTVHDDLAYTFPRRAQAREATMRDAWRDAAARFVISQALGEEYSRRYGSREFVVVTDGLSHLGAPHRASSSGELRIYFMGLFHMSYERNLRALLDALKILEDEHPELRVTVTLRCEHVRAQVLGDANRVHVLPFADEAQLQRDLETADLLYMPMPFGAEHDTFARYSLSTKMVTYVGSGVPILYHGPETSAAFRLLNANAAAMLLPTAEPTQIARALAGLTSETRSRLALNALELARREFMLSEQTERFWGTIGRCLSPR
ncbi:MAG: glycosyltransferase [Verrucomicrobiota bacterium]|nr:glycosyltransferase [Verrucomicrobiota bacterium]